MIRRHVWLLVFGFVLVLTTTSARAAPNFVFAPGASSSPSFQTRFTNCIDQFNAAGGLARSILKQLNGARITVSSNNGGAATGDPNPGGDTAGLPLDLSWDPGLDGNYDGDGAPMVPCAVLLHELQHAARYFKGQECNGPMEGSNVEARFYDEELGARAENWWLNRLHLQQRTKYDFFGDLKDLSPWTQWPKPGRVPKAPPCDRCPQPDMASTSAAPNAAACTRCTRFHQTGCVDLRGGIYSGGDHRRVAFGSLRINVGDRGYCQGREPCEFKDCVTCPHLDTAFPEGVTVTAVATPGPESRFARWGPGACEGKGPVCTFVARRESCISAQFLLTNPTAPPQSLPSIPCPEDP